MDWKIIIADVQKRTGLTQSEIARAVGCGQATVNGLANGKTNQPSYALGVAILSLKPKRKARKESVAAQPATAA